MTFYPVLAALSWWSRLRHPRAYAEHQRRVREQDERLRFG